jgi:hypothetical protein
MAILENQRRYSKEYYDECTAVQHIPNGWLNVTEKLQEDIVREFGFNTQFEISIALNTLRRAHLIWPNNETFQQSIYVKNNKAALGTLKVGDVSPNVALTNKNLEPLKLNTLLQHKYSIVFAGSHT